MYLCKEGVTAVYQPKKDTEKAAVELCVRGCIRGLFLYMSGRRKAAIWKWRTKEWHKEEIYYHFGRTLKCWMLRFVMEVLSMIFILRMSLSKVYILQM